MRRKSPELDAVLNDQDSSLEGTYEEAGLGLFLNQLKSHPQAYRYFLSEAYRLKVLQPSIPPVRPSKPPPIRPSQALVVPTSVSDSLLRPSKARAKAEPLLGSVRSHSTRRVDGKGSHPSDITGSHLVPIVRDAMGRVTKVYYLDPALVDKTVVMEKYREICGLLPGSEIRTARLSADRFRGYLELRYPCEMAEIMVRLLDFTTSKSPPQYFTDIERLITLRDDRLVQATFDMLDLDKDKLITTKDAFQAIEKRLFDTYDSDLVKLQHILQLKKGVGESEGKREGVTYSEFRRLDFIGARPQLAVDFLQYISGLNILQLAGFVTQTAKLKREPSDVQTKHMYSGERYSYLTQLVGNIQERVLASYAESHREALITRFQELQCGEVQSAIITASSFQAGFVSFYLETLFRCRGALPYRSSLRLTVSPRWQGPDQTQVPAEPQTAVFS